MGFVERTASFKWEDTEPIWTMSEEEAEEVEAEEWSSNFNIATLQAKSFNRLSVSYMGHRN